MTDLTPDHNDPTMQTIENARLSDIRPGDHVTFTSRVDLEVVILTWIREGVAHHRNEWGDWCAEGGLCITDGEGENITITIRRTTTAAEEDGKEADR